MSTSSSFSDIPPIVSLSAIIFPDDPNSQINNKIVDLIFDCSSALDHLLCDLISFIKKSPPSSKKDYDDLYALFVGTHKKPFDDRSRSVQQSIIHLLSTIPTSNSTNSSSDIGASNNNNTVVTDTNSNGNDACCSIFPHKCTDCIANCIHEYRSSSLRRDPSFHGKTSIEDSLKSYCKSCPYCKGFLKEESKKKELTGMIASRTLTSTASDKSMSLGVSLPSDGNDNNNNNNNSGGGSVVVVTPPVVTPVPTINTLIPTPDKYYFLTLTASPTDGLPDYITSQLVRSYIRLTGMPSYPVVASCYTIELTRQGTPHLHALIRFSSLGNYSPSFGSKAFDHRITPQGLGAQAIREKNAKSLTKSHRTYRLDVQQVYDYITKFGSATGSPLPSFF